jgi:hypothetical protein
MTPGLRKARDRRGILAGAERCPANVLEAIQFALVQPQG